LIVTFAPDAFIFFRANAMFWCFWQRHLFLLKCLVRHICFTQSEGKFNDWKCHRSDDCRSNSEPPLDSWHDSWFLALISEG
jgi:hypothetical protein